MSSDTARTAMPAPERTLPGRTLEMPLSRLHAVLGTGLRPPFPEGSQQAIFAMGCFWGSEPTFWRLPGVHATAVGYSGGLTPNPTYEEVCSSRTGHAESVLVVYDPKRLNYPTLLKTFWENHDPTQGMRQGADAGTQYRSAIYFLSEEQRRLAERSRDEYQGSLSRAGLGEITTEIVGAGPFYYAEEYHQQYLEKNPQGYCGVHGTGVSCPAGILAPP